FDQNMRRTHQAQQNAPSALVAKIEADALLVSTIGFPVRRDPLDNPVAQGITADDRLDLDHICAEVGEEMRGYVARHYTRQVKHANASEREVIGARVGLVWVNRVQQSCSIGNWWKFRHPSR